MTIDLPLCTEDVSHVLNTIIEKEQLKDPKVTFQTGSKIGEGYMAVDTAVEIKDGDKLLNLFIKTAPKDEKLREIMMLRGAFLNEIYFYSGVQPFIENFYKIKTGKILEIAPMCYATNEEEMKEIIVLENMKIIGFDLPDTSKFFNKEVVKAIITKYGKFYGISFALKDQNEDEFNKISSRLPGESLGSVIRRMGMVDIIKSCCSFVGKYFKLPVDKLYSEKLEHIKENIENLLLASRNFQDHTVLIHGDCNSNNYMVRKQPDNLEARLIDFQGLSYASPIYDLSYFFYSTSASEENLADFDIFLDIYYDSLYKTVKELGSDPEIVCPRHALQTHWKVYGPLTFSMAILSVHRIVHPENQVNIMEVLGIEENVKPDPVINEKKYAETFIPIFKHMVDRNIL